MALTGAILGDIIGSRYEYSINVDWQCSPLFDENRCEFTDDTVLSLAVKDAILHGKDIRDTLLEYGRAYPDAGYGSSFDRWLWSDSPQPYGSCGNGSAMRVSFVADFYPDLADVQHVAKRTAMVTHNHPEGIKGAVVAATCIWMAKNGKGKHDIYEYLCSEYPPGQYPYHADMPVAELRRKERWDTTCQGSVPVAVRCFLESWDYESFIRNVFSIDCDRDTIGAIGGGIAENFYHGVGFNPRPKLEHYLDARLLAVLDEPYEPGVVKPAVFGEVEGSRREGKLWAKSPLRGS